MAAAGKAKEADAARCRRHPSHRHAAGVCPFCLSDRLSRLSAAASAAGAADAASEPSSASSSGAASVASAQTAPPCREARRARLGMLMRQEEPEAAAGGRHGKQEAEEGERKKPAKRGNFWTRLQQASWYRRDGCSVASVKKGAAAPPHKRAASLF